MKRKMYARMFAFLSIVCALVLGLYMNFSEGCPEALTSRAIMVAAYLK